MVYLITDHVVSFFGGNNRLPFSELRGLFSASLSPAPPTKEDTSYPSVSLSAVFRDDIA